MMFEKDNTGVLKGYYDRMHPTAKMVIEDVLQDPAAEIKPEDMSLVWRGWVKKEFMEKVFGGSYRGFNKKVMGLAGLDVENLDQGTLIAVGGGEDVEDFRYGKWTVHCMVDLVFGKSMSESDFAEMLRMAVEADRWKIVMEGMIRITELGGELEVSMAIRGLMRVRY